MKRSTSSGARAGARAAEGSSITKRIIAIAVVAILLLGGAVWAFLRNQPDPQVEKVKQMQAEMFKEDMTPEQRRENFQLVHQEMEKLTPEQREQVHQEGRERFERRMDEQIVAYYALPAEQRVAYLDKQIQEMEQHRKEWESHRGQGGPFGPPPGGAGGPPGGAGGPPGGPGGPQAGGGPPTPPRDNSSEARQQRRNQRLDRSTAEQRSLRSAYFAEMQKRRTELGLPASPFPGRGPGPGR